MNKEELLELNNSVKKNILLKIEEYLDDTVIDIDAINCLGKLYTRVDQVW
tara:strand:- start:3737 stop:3886 length:150 start_codon:yes stop_codon:yes gene_type:complete